MLRLYTQEDNVGLKVCVPPPASSTYARLELHGAA